MLESTQQGELDITPWLSWFRDCLDCAFDGAETILASVMRKARFRESVAGQPLNERQRKVVNSPDAAAQPCRITILPMCPPLAR